MTVTSSPAVDPEFQRLEKAFDARLGIYAVVTGTGQAGSDTRSAAGVHYGRMAAWTLSY
ncbi:hypothetical protein ACLQ28_32860 [Micromonospora sp. DT201]|uniref:hypothetical protein n=1 Tax=Micromonospora sp. DT201 TaxID=3393442 RepID=UPI003CF67978